MVLGIFPGVKLLNFLILRNKAVIKKDNLFLGKYSIHMSVTL